MSKKERPIISQLHTMLSAHIRAIDQWIDDIGVDFRYMGSQQDDKGVFPAVWRRNDAWENYDYRAAPRYNLNIYVNTVRFIFIGLLIALAGFNNIINILPYAVIIMMYASLNWTRLAKGLALTFVFAYLQVFRDCAFIRYTFKLYAYGFRSGFLQSQADSQILQAYLQAGELHRETKRKAKEHPFGGQGIKQRQQKSLSY